MRYYKLNGMPATSVNLRIDTNGPRSNSNSNPTSAMHSRDWRSALRTPSTYRIGNRTLRFNSYFALLLGGVFAVTVVFFYVHTTSSVDASWKKSTYVGTIANKLRICDAASYNNTYPLSPSITQNNGAVVYRIAIVADMDTKSKCANDDGSIVWRSFLKKGSLCLNADKSDLKIKWDSGTPITLETSFSHKDRGMELSELVTFNGKLLAFDDRTGIVYELINDKPIPWVILLDGNGKSMKGFKSEWATVKQKMLYVGSMGKEWTTSAGEFQNENPMFVKVISPTGEVHSLDWSFNYKLLRQQSLDIIWPGYMIHESGVWSDVHKRWFFLPRRCSGEKYNETQDEHMGCNVLISANERFTKIHTVHLDPANTAPTHGFSSFKFVPGTNDQIILAIKSEELNGKTATFITAFDIAGNTIMPEQQIATKLKYEGIEFI